MVPTKRKTKHKLEKNKAAEEVLDLVISYIHDVETRNSVSLVSRKFYEIDGITRKRLTVHTHYYPNLSCLSKIFPFMETLTLKGTPCGMLQPYHNDIRITPWIKQLALEFRYLKEFHIHRLVVHDEDLETLARTRGKDLRSLKISRCIGFSADGLMHVSKYCNQLRTLCLRYPKYFTLVNYATWLHQLALNSTVLERLHVTDTDISEEDLTLLAKNCCNSLISLKIGACYLSKLGDAFRYVVRLQHFGGYFYDKVSELVGFQFPPNMRSLSIQGLLVREHIPPFLNQIRKLNFLSSSSWYECHWLLIERCPNLEVLYTQGKCGDKQLQVIGKFCKKLRKLTLTGYETHVTHVGLISLAKECTKLEYLNVRLGDISYEALESLGTHLKNLRKFCMHLVKKHGKIDLPLENGIRAMLMGCNKLESLYINLWYGGFTDVGFEYIGKYGANLRSLTLAGLGMSNAGLVKLSKGCPRLRKLKLWGFPAISKQVVASSVFDIQSLRYVWLYGVGGNILFGPTRPGFQL